MAVADQLRKIPTWGWLLVGGASLGIGYSFYRDRHAKKLDGAAGDAALEAGLGSEDYYYGGAQPAPIGVVSPAAPYDNAGEVGAIGQTAFETLVDAVTGIVGTVPALIEASRPDTVEPTPITVVMPQSPPPGSGENSGPAAPPAAATPAAPTSVTILGRTFSGAYRYAEIATPALKSRDFNVYWHKPHPDQRWRRTPSGTWTKIGEGNFGG